MQEHALIPRLVVGRQSTNRPQSVQSIHFEQPLIEKLGLEGRRRAASDKTREAFLNFTSQIGSDKNMPYICETKMRRRD